MLGASHYSICGGTLKWTPSVQGHELNRMSDLHGNSEDHKSAHRSLVH
jgi:hypothetical protein